MIVTALALLTPPFQVPDEQQHFFRSYQLSEAHFDSTSSAGEAGAVLPSSLIELSADFLGTRALHADRVIQHRSFTKTWSALDRPLDPARREFIPFTGAAAYWPGAYLAQASAIALGRSAGLGPLALLYVARLLNAWVAVGLIGVALHLIPTGRLALFVVGLLPMTLYEIASCSADAATIATALLFTAFAISSCAVGRWSPAAIAGATATALVFCPLKPVYAPLLLLAFPLGPRRSPTHGLVVHTAILAAVLGVTFAWLLASPIVNASPLPGVDSAAQISFLAAHPLHFIHTVVWTTRVYGFDWAKQTIGVLGWLNVELPRPMLAIPVLLLVACTVVKQPGAWRPDPVRAAWMVGLMLASLSLILLALEVLWSPVGTLIAEGVQGRYFIPLAGAACVALEGLLPVLPPSLNRAIPSLAIAEGSLTIAVVVREYGLF